MNKIAVSGSTGRMGQMLIHEVYKNSQCELSAVLARTGSPFIGQDVGHMVGLSPMGLELSDDIAKALGSSDVVIDFSKPEGTLALLKLNQHTPMMIGVTGFVETHLEQIKKASLTTPIVLASNTSLGAVILKRVSKQIAEALGPDFDIEIFEMHHRGKVDAPSGTTSVLAEELAQVPGFHINSQTDRSGQREKGAIQYVVSRGGGVIADHDVVFAGKKEMITLSHRTLDRSLFTQGALKAAVWVKDKPPGLYSMEDVIGL